MKRVVFKRDLMKDIQQPINDAPKHVQNIIWRVLEAERQKLYMDRPHLVQDVVTIIKEEVR